MNILSPYGELLCSRGLLWFPIPFHWSLVDDHFSLTTSHLLSLKIKHFLLLPWHPVFFQDGFHCKDNTLQGCGFEPIVLCSAPETGFSLSSSQAQKHQEKMSSSIIVKSLHCPPSFTIVTFWSSLNCVFQSLQSSAEGLSLELRPWH